MFAEMPTWPRTVPGLNTIKTEAAQAIDTARMRRFIYNLSFEISVAIRRRKRCGKPHYCSFKPLGFIYNAFTLNPDNLLRTVVEVPTIQF